MKQVAYFHPLLRAVHWLMAAAIIAMLFIGVVMVSTVSSLHSLLVTIHKPLGLMILLLALVRLWLRFYTATVACLAAGLATRDGASFALGALCDDAGTTANWLGDAFGGRLSGDARRRIRAATDSSGE